MASVCTHFWNSRSRVVCSSFSIRIAKSEEIRHGQETENARLDKAGEYFPSLSRSRTNDFFAIESPEFGYAKGGVDRLARDLSAR